MFAALAKGKAYDQLPSTLQAVIGPEDYAARVKEYHIARGAAWAGSPAQSLCSESEYYESLVKAYKSWMRVRHDSRACGVWTFCAQSVQWTQPWTQFSTHTHSMLRGAVDPRCLVGERCARRCFRTT